MKKAIRFFSMALAILMLLPMLSAFPVKVRATESTYDATHDGQLLRSVNFNADYWHPDYQRIADGTSSNMGADVAVSDDGTSVKLTVQNANNKRAMWGGFYSGEPDGSPADLAYDEALGAVLPIEPGAKYTMTFDLTLGCDNVAFGIQVDGHNALAIQGNGQSRWYSWNDYGQLKNGVVQPGVGNTSNSNEKWDYHTTYDASRRDMQTFAVVVDCDAKTMSLYGKYLYNDAFFFCRSITYDDEHVWNSDYFRCRLNVRAVSGTPDESYTAEVSNLNIYKGNAMNPLFGDGCRLPYWSRPDDTKLVDVNFNADEWDPAFATESNCGAEVTPSFDGSAVHFTVLSSSYKRAMWGGFYSEEPSGAPETVAYNEALGTALPMKAGAKYTMIFDLTLGHDNVALGIQVDGYNALTIQGNGQSRWYSWNDYGQLKNGVVQPGVGDTSDNNEKWNYHIADGSTKRDTHTFAVTVDYDAKTMALYVLDENDGCFYFCRSITYDDEHVWNSDYFRCRLNVRAVGGTPNANYTADLANLKIYKGNVMHALWGNTYVLPYASHEDDELLLKVDFNSSGWNPVFATESNQGAEVTPSPDGSTVDFTVLSSSYKRAMWGGFYSGEEDGSPADLSYEEALGTALPMKAGAKYTMIFDLTLGHNNVALGIQVDGYNALTIQGNGQSRWYSWNDYGELKNGVVQPGVGDTSEGNEMWNAHTDVPIRNKQTFAVTVDYDAKTMTLYVKDVDNRFYVCRSITYDDENVWDSDYFRCRLNVRAVSGAPNANYTAEISDLKIYKGWGPLAARLSVMSYNVEMYGHGGSAWDDRHPEKAMETVLNYSPDVFGLQEVDSHWEESQNGKPSFISNLTSNGYTRIRGTELSTNPHSHWPELYYKTEKFTELGRGNVQYKADAMPAFPKVLAYGADMNQDQSGRQFTWALLQEKLTGKKVLAISTHLHYRNKDTQDDPNSTANILVREYEIRLLLKWINTRTFAYDAVVIVGDMNAHYLSGSGKPTMEIFKSEGGFSITRDVAKDKGSILGTTDGWDEATATDRGLRKDYIFDYILTKGNVETAYYTVVDNKIDNGGTSYPSDHLPILSNILVY